MQQIFGALRRFFWLVIKLAEIPSAEQSINLMVANMHSIAASHTPVGIGLGIVVKAPPELAIAWNGILIEKEQIYIDQFLLPQYQRLSKGETKLPEVKGAIRTNTQTRRGGSGEPSYTSHNHKVNDDYKADAAGEYQASVIYTDCGLQVGDYVAMLPINNGQQFIVLSKLVYLPEFKFEDEGGESSDNTGGFI